MNWRVVPCTYVEKPDAVLETTIVFMKGSFREWGRVTSHRFDQVYRNTDPIILYKIIIWKPDHPLSDYRGTSYLVSLVALPKQEKRTGYPVLFPSFLGLCPTCHSPQ